MCLTGSMSSGPDICVACTSNAQCGTGGTCLPAGAGVCVTCTSDANCASNTAKPLCDTTFTGNCVQCKDSRDCVKYPGFPLCDPIALTCKAVP
jgi:Cys-rich repeat protein